MTPLQYNVLQLLADGCFHSGEQLAQKNGVSRAAVWKALGVLRSFGLCVDAVTGRGYRLKGPLELLDEGEIRQALGDAEKNSQLKLDVLHSVDSTNAWLMRLTAKQRMHACVAEHQTSGRGRRGRAWFSPFASNLYLSLRYQFDDGMGRLAGLSLAVAVAVLRTLREIEIGDAKLKWPNDIYWDGRKLGGILLELKGESSGACHVVIGIGLNFDMSANAYTAVDQPWVDLRSIKDNVSRNQFSGYLLRNLLDVLNIFSLHGLAPFRREWQEADLLCGRLMQLSFAEGRVEGIGRGIAQDGALLLEIDGKIEGFNFGEVSARLAGNVDDPPA